MAEGNQGEYSYAQHAHITIYLPKISDTGYPENLLQSDTFCM